MPGRPRGDLPAAAGLLVDEDPASRGWPATTRMAAGAHRRGTVVLLMFFACVFWFPLFLLVYWGCTQSWRV